MQDFQFNFFFTIIFQSLLNIQWYNFIKFLPRTLREHKTVRKDSHPQYQIKISHRYFATKLILWNEFSSSIIISYAILIVCKLPSLIHNPVFFSSYLLVINTWRRHEARNTISNDPDNRREKGVEPDANNRFVDTSWFSGIPTKLEND